MDNFYEQIKFRLEDRKEPTFNIKDWQALEAQLGHNYNYGKLALWVLLPLIGLTILNGYWFYKTPRNPLPNINNSKIRDTIVVQKTITRIDTIYLSQTLSGKDYSNQLGQLRHKVRSLQRQLTRQSSSLHTLNLLEPKEPQKISNIETDLSFLTQNSRSSRIKATINKAIKFNQQHFHKLRNSTHTKNLLNYDRQLVEEDQIHENVVFQNKQKTLTKSSKLPYSANISKSRNKNSKTSALALLVDEFKSFNINEFQLGLDGTLIYPSYKDLTYDIGKSYGINAVLPLSEHFQFESKFQYYSSTIESKEIANFNHLENVPNLPLDLRLNKIEAPFETYQFKIGLDYLGNADGFLRPLIGVGVGAAYVAQNEILFEYENLTNPTTWEVEQNFKLSKFNFKNLYFKAGLDFMTKANLIFRFHGDYKAVLGDKTYYNPNYVSLGLGVRYQF